MKIRRLSALLLGLAVIAGASVAARAIPDTVRIPQATPRTTTPPGVLFSHAVHAGQRCYACHPSVFPQTPLAFTHADMNQGRFCGRCHDGHQAAAIARTACEACHAAH